MSFQRQTRRSTHGGKSSVSATALAAVALQDHMMRSLSLQDPIRRKPIPHSRPAKPTNVCSVIDTGRNKVRSKKLSDEETKKEYVLDAKPAPLTLAQKLGLVEQPQALLSEEEWHKAKLRSNERDDSRQPCVICKEDFGTQEQILLSCSHVFHRACLEAFERFSGKKCCPMCRKEQYQKRVIYEGAEAFRESSATKIQALWRGYVTRCWYRKLRETVPPNDPKLRKKFYEEKFQRIIDRMVRSVDYDVNSFLREMDNSLEESRGVMRQLDEATRYITDEQWEEVHIKAVVRGDTDCPICLTSLDAPSGACTDRQPTNLTSSAKTKKKMKKPGDDTKKLETLNNPADGSPGEAAGTDEGDGSKAATRSVMLLSCSHVFHHTCLVAFEEFSVGERRFVCPVCRSSYQKRQLNI